MLTAQEQEEAFAEQEKLTQNIIVQAAGFMLASGMSESAVVRQCEEVAKQYIERLSNRVVAMREKQS